MKRFSLLPRSFDVLLTPESLVLVRSGGLGKARAPREVRRYPLSEGRGLAGVMQEIARQVRPSSDDTWYLGLPLAHFTAVNFQLPAAAQRNLDQAVHYGLMRHVPFDLSEAYVHYQAHGAGDRLEIAALVALKDELLPYLEAVSASGITLSAVLPTLVWTAWRTGLAGNAKAGRRKGPDAVIGRDGVYVAGGGRQTEIMAWKDGRIMFQSWESGSDAEAGARFLSQARAMLGGVRGAPMEPVFLLEPGLETAKAAEALGVDESAVSVLTLDELGSSCGLEGCPYQIDFVPPEVIRRRKRAFVVMAAAALLLLVSLAAYPLAGALGKQAQLDRLDQEIARIQAQAAELSAMDKASQAEIQRLASMAEAVKAQPSVAETLKEITELVPEDDYLKSFEFSSGKIEIQGVASSATGVLEILENSPLFQDVHFASQVVRAGQMEMFSIAMAHEGS